MGIKEIIAKIEKENNIFAKKSNLDTLSFPDNVIGRQQSQEKLVRLLLQYKQEYLVPFISVYGRSGSGKSTIVRHVCENLDEISFCFVNIRRAKTVFGVANLILAELGQASLKSAQGINMAVGKIEDSIVAQLDKEGKNVFVLILDEYDMLFYDKRGNPSDFVYKLLVIEERLHTKGKMLCIIAISNNGLADYAIDDRVRSRIGNSEIFFEPYSKDDVYEILKDRSAKAFSKKVKEDVLMHCAELSSAVYGDARRAIDLLRVGAEIASSEGKGILPEHIDSAQKILEKDRTTVVLKSSSTHTKILCLAMARITYLTDQPWQSTAIIYKQYQNFISRHSGKIKPVGYRRVAELLNELENTGFTVSQTGSKGRHGYGTQHKLTVDPEIIVNTIIPSMWKNLAENKARHYDLTHNPASKYPNDVRGKWDKFEGEQNWQKYVNLDYVIEQKTDEKSANKK
ncbi:Cell division control protein 6 family protein [Nitrosotalea devaniterrae]|uniref:ORC1-type DNA replication protein n=1 Tax=Nitrosotalea devaniterrae TaxID=1078905 RepID=A0A128A0M4_9ARCH|nr:Cell division control protein 6 family protein [Candidatus Nitrosotalea devanaterra]